MSKSRVLAEHRAQPRHDPLGLPLLVRIGVPAELEVDAPDVVGLAVQQRRLVRMERRIEPEPALGREIRFHVDVGDQEAVAEHLPFRIRGRASAAPGCARRRRRSASRRRACTRRRAWPPARRHRRRAARRRRPCSPSAARRRRARCARSTRYSSNQYCCRLTNAGRRWPGSGRRSKRIDELVAEEDLADVPADALVDDLLAAAAADRGSPARASRSRSRASRPTRCGRRRATTTGMPRCAEIDRRGEADRPGADDRRRSACCPARRAPPGAGTDRSGSCRSSRGIRDGAVRGTAHPSSASHSSLSRCAVQIRGSRYCVASSYARDTSNGRQWSKITQWPNFGLSAA